MQIIFAGPIQIIFIARLHVQVYTIYEIHLRGPPFKKAMLFPSFLPLSPTLVLTETLFTESCVLHLF